MQPRVSAEDALRVASECYQITGTVTSLPSYADQNYHIVAADGREFLLKISGRTEPREQLERQNAALAHLAEVDPELPIARLIPTVDGDLITSFEAPDGECHLIRLFTYLPGIVLADVSPHSDALLREIGRTLGAIDRGLSSFSHPHPHPHAVTNSDSAWNLEFARDVIERHKDAITGPSEAAIIDRVLEYWTSIVEPQQPNLRRGVIYNDANDYNVLVSADPREPRRVTGFIDFGDLIESHIVCDPAIAIAYAMLGKREPIAAAAQLLHGYHHAFPLAETELEVMYPLALARLCVCVCLSAALPAEVPADDYLRVSEAPAWETLERLLVVHPRFARNMFRQACGFAPCPRSKAVVDWLSASASSFAAVVSPDPRTTRCTILDLSVATLEIDSPPQVVGTERFTQLVQARLAEEGTSVGIGRYNEPRSLYQSEVFDATDCAGERRTIHLGVDLFLPAGTPVHAPLDGVVVGVVDNEGHLDYGPTVILEHAPDGGPKFFTLYGHLASGALASLQGGQRVPRGEIFAHLGGFAENGHWPPHLHFQIITDLLDRTGDFPGVASPSERDVWLSISPDPNLILGLGEGVSTRDRMTRDEILMARHEYMSSTLSLLYRHPLHIVRGYRQFLYDEVGREYLDCVNNVCHVGHCHPRVVAAARAQMATLNTNTRYLHENIVEYAQRLVALLPDPLSVCFFVNSGSEANELALRLARTHTGREQVIVVDHAYHGNTGGLVEMSPYKFDGPGGTGEGPYVHKVVMPDDYRGPYRRGDVRCGSKYALHVRRAAERPPAAFIVESLLGCGGQIELPPGYLAEAFSAVRKAGGVCIADEVQVGFGRVGTHFWGFETQGVVPDIVTMGKPMGNGHPLGAVVTTPEIAGSFDSGMEYFNTFGGNPVSCAVGLAVLDVIDGERLQERALEVGGRLKERLTALTDEHAVVGDVRGRGLFLGVELVSDRYKRTPAPAAAAYVIERMKDCGVLLGVDGPDLNVLKIKPPLVFSHEDADRLVSELNGVMREDAARY